MAVKTKPEDRKLLPHSEDAERAVIGSILIDPDAILRAQEIGLQIDHFYNRHLGWIYEAAQLLAVKGKPVDTTLLQAELDGRQDGADGRSRLATIGGHGVLLNLISTTFTSVNVGHYAQEVVNLARKRDLLAASARIAELTQNHEGDIDDLFSEVSRLILPTVSVAGNRSHSYGSENALADYLKNQHGRAARLLRDPDALIVTGLPDLDAILGDLLPGYLHVVAARASVGKTMYMERVTEANARRGKRIAFYHLELGHEMMMDRLIARHAIVSLRELRRGYDGKELDQAINEIAPWFSNVVYIHCPGWSAERIAADIQRLRARGECDLAIVDYLQKLTLPNTRAGLNAAMLYGLEAEALKIAAEVCEIPIVLGSQVSRDYKGREDKRPHMEDIRNSGEIEEKANQIVILRRPGKRADSMDVGTVEPLEASVEKNTGGGIGTVSLAHVIGRYLISGLRKGE